MNKKTIITALLALVAMTGRGQTDTKGGISKLIHSLGVNIGVCFQIKGW